jgi:2-keto-4-pentenoate hydratase/2-oxohepta-3-ene-1,7-dioic acid hydratase in catechol pathway
MIYARGIHSNKTFDLIIEDEKAYPISGSFYSKFKKTGECFDKKNILFLPPCTPSKIICVGLNYNKHAQEMNLDLPKNPIIFMKPTTTIIGHLDNIIYPAGVEKLDYEAELGIVIKKLTKNIKKEDAKNHILGYTCCNDVTARCIQKNDGQWTRAKSFDTFCPFGQIIRDDIDPKNLNIELKLNGEIKQKSNTKDMIFDVFEIVEFISSVMTLLPNDLILTGTPEGIGQMQKGDCVEIEIENLGILRNFVVK